MQLSASNVPAWLAFDASTGALTGTPTAAEIGSSEDVLITAGDGELSTDLLVTIDAEEGGIEAALAGGDHRGVTDEATYLDAIIDTIDTFGLTGRANLRAMIGNLKTGGVTFNNAGLPICGAVRAARPRADTGWSAERMSGSISCTRQRNVAVDTTGGTMKRLHLATIVLLCATCMACTNKDDALTAANGANLILTNARVYTLAWHDPARDGTPAADAPHSDRGWRPDAEAVVIQDGQIAFVGTTQEALKHQGSATRVVDLGGATVLPGLVDSHTHDFELGAALQRVNLFDVDTEEEAVARVVERAKSVPAGEWILGQGWDEGAWANRYPDKALLSQAVPDHPVFLASLHGFAGWANQQALDQAGISAATDVPTGGEIRLGDDGEPNGLFLNRAVPVIADAVPAPSRAVVIEQILAGLGQMARDGYVAVHEAGLNTEQMSVLEELEATGRLPVRVYAMLSLRDETLMRRWIAKGPDQDDGSMLVTRTVKAYYDGALGSRGARMLDDYADKPGFRGVSGGDYGFNEALMEQAVAAGFQVAIHAIGDAGNRESLDILERITSNHPGTAAQRHRIEHAQVVSPGDMPRFARLGVIASMEPAHAMEDKAWAEDRLGPERILRAYAWRSLRMAGANLTFNADNPGSDHSIFYGLHSAITRQDKDLHPEGGWYPEQALTVDETVRAYTLWSAYASFREGKTGSIEEGRWADLTVMDMDPFVLAEDSPDDLLLGQILLTVVNGNIVYER